MSYGSFNDLARDYDAVWTNSAVGTHQRRAVWRWIDPLFRPDDRVLDLGCGTGVDALHLMERGIQTYGIDSCQAMVEQARRRGVDADCGSIQNLQAVLRKFDGAISNFGVLNCVPSLELTATVLAGSIRSGGHVALCFMGRFCFWESACFLAQGKFQKAFRRFSGVTTSTLGVDVFYPSARSIVSAFRPSFRLLRSCGIGLCVPPSYIKAIGGRGVGRLAAIDRLIAHWPMLRSLADHRLYILQRL